MGDYFAEFVEEAVDHGPLVRRAASANAIEVGLERQMYGAAELQVRAGFLRQLRRELHFG